MRTTRLRRLGRRLEQWHQHPDPQLSRHVLREADFFGCPLNPLDRNALPALRLWLQEELTSLETAQKEKRLQEWKHLMQQQDGPVWKWLAKAKKTELTSGLKNAQGAVLTPAQTMQEVESFWRQHWPSNEDLENKHQVLENMFTEAGLADNVRHPDMPPLHGEDLKRTLTRQRGKAPGPEGGGLRSCGTGLAPLSTFLQASSIRLRKVAAGPRLCASGDKFT